MEGCVICFDAIVGRAYRCADPDCVTQICRECIESYIAHCAREGTITACPNRNCNSYFTSLTLQGLDARVLQRHEEGCLAFLLRDHGDQAQRQLQRERMVKELRAERLRFLEDRFPASIAAVARITFAAKLRRLERQRAVEVDARLKSLARRCMNTACKGFLDGELVCQLCSSRFCQRCEKILVNDAHQCDVADVASVSVISQMVHCPKCRLPVIRSEGCDHMHCTNCRTAFNYKTGEVGGEGNGHNANLLQRQDRTRLVSQDDFYREMLGDNMRLLLRLEGVCPAPVAQETILLPIKHFLEDGDRVIAARNVATRFANYLRARYRCRNYQRRLAELERRLRQKESPGRVQEFLEAAIREFHVR